MPNKTALASAAQHMVRYSINVQPGATPDKPYSLARTCIHSTLKHTAARRPVAQTAATRPHSCRLLSMQPAPGRCRYLLIRQLPAAGWCGWGAVLLVLCSSAAAAAAHSSSSSSSSPASSSPVSPASRLRLWVAPPSSCSSRASQAHRLSACCRVKVTSARPRASPSTQLDSMSTAAHVADMECPHVLAQA